MAKAPRDVERIYSTADAAAKLRRLADALETDQPFRIQVAGERIRVPARGEFSIEHERGEDTEEIEFQLKWTLDAESSGSDEGPSSRRQEPATAAIGWLAGVPDPSRRPVAGGRSTGTPAAAAARAGAAPAQARIRVSSPRTNR